MAWNLDHSYARLPQALWVDQKPIPVADPSMVLVNGPLSNSLGIDPAWWESAEGVAVAAGNALPPAGKPIAQAYAGHQFGHLTMLGDGRAVLLGEQIDAQGQRWDIQLKGSGRTPFSRGGDGRAALGPMLREYLISEAMHALGIPTTRALAVVRSGETVRRQQALPGAILVRVAASHVRVGTLQFCTGGGHLDALSALVEHCLQRHYPTAVDHDEPALALLEAVAGAQATLIAHWMRVGFIHGVMNTDNMALCGETIDYGPCAFMETYAAGTVYSSIDRQGRYAYGNQPGIAQWNLARCAEALLPLLQHLPEQGIPAAEAILHDFRQTYDSAYYKTMVGKLGLPAVAADDQGKALVDLCLRCFHASAVDYTNGFLDLSDLLSDAQRMDLRSIPGQRDQDWQDFLSEWQRLRNYHGIDTHSARTTMAQHNPAIIPRNHLIEEALSAAEDGDLTPCQRMLEVCRNPYAQPVSEVLRPYQQPAAADAPPYQTFCGT